MPPTMHRRERWARTPTTRATARAARTGAVMEPGPFALKMMKLGRQSTRTSRATMRTGKIRPSAMDC